ncbi:MAG: hypothetical protein JNJ89_02055 [Rubrivivax sp.]|nr:hypothetical protein [Rubrivivax sp.]
MNPTQRPQRQSTIVRLSLLGAAALAACGGAMAQANPFYVGASQVLSQDSNFFRVAGGQPQTRETVSTTSLLAGMDQSVGRQRLFADAAVRLNRHAENQQLDYTGSSLLVGADLSAIDAFAGRVAYSSEKALARYGADFGFVDPNTRVTQKTEEFSLRGQYGLVSLLGVEGGVVRRQLSFSQQSGNEFEHDQVSAGLKYRPSGGLTFGLGYRRTDGSYPFTALPGGGVGPDDYKRDDIDLTALWVATGASTITARLSRTDEKHQGLPVRNVSGSTGAVSWAYKITGKLLLGADYLRDTGAESSFNPGASGGPAPIVSSSPLTTMWMLHGEYEVTGKIKMLASVRQLNRDLVNNVGATGDDTLTETRLGVNWAPLRSVSVGCSVGYEKRDSSGTLSYEYSNSNVRCLAQFRTQ